MLLKHSESSSMPTKQSSNPKASMLESGIVQVPGSISPQKLNRAAVRQQLKRLGRQQRKGKQSHATKDDIRAILESKWKQSNTQKLPVSDESEQQN